LAPVIHITVMPAAIATIVCTVLATNAAPNTAPACRPQPTGRCPNIGALRRMRAVRVVGSTSSVEGEVAWVMLPACPTAR
jgi:hypothetical protein